MGVCVEHTISIIKLSSRHRSIRSEVNITGLPGSGPGPGPCHAMPYQRNANLSIHYYFTFS